MHGDIRMMYDICIQSIYTMGGSPDALRHKPQHWNQVRCTCHWRVSNQYHRKKWFCWGCTWKRLAKSWNWWEYQALQLQQNKSKPKKWIKAEAEQGDTCESWWSLPVSAWASDGSRSDQASEVSRQGATESLTAGRARKEIMKESSHAYFNTTQN